MKWFKRVKKTVDRGKRVDFCSWSEVTEMDATCIGQIVTEKTTNQNSFIKRNVIFYYHPLQF